MSTQAFAFLFPGQGSQAVGMGRELNDNFAAVRAVFEEADEALGFRLSSLCFDGPEDRLRLTAFTQPAIVTVSVAADRVLREHGIQPAVVAGHSLGEYAALVSAGVLTFRDAVQAVHARGTYMQEAVPAGQGAMAAVLGLEAAAVIEACAATSAATGETVSAANLNAPTQIVISGTVNGVAQAGALAKEAGAKRVVPLPVSAPFHCALMQPAQDRLAPLLAGLPFQDAQVPVVPNVLAQPEQQGDALRRALVQQVTGAVRWVECMEAVQTRFAPVQWIEVGPGKVLGGLLRQIDRSLSVLNVEDSASLAKSLASLEQ
ncbi:ACP S-malonyltransferase [Acidipila sp. EB88]|uniref:ACP S-malonyltransferase n=1 Tax=Acidipila sp. EB88 TaxID=2305226 RepID=UPI000F5D606F|nr:ACP S-malonyltransferase [Acidipila sp. EB88]RRA48384.1 [acyl-carrier-protein] S-malonyltransferase [Acidipila sp. EB88]